MHQELGPPSHNLKGVDISLTPTLCPVPYCLGRSQEVPLRLVLEDNVPYYTIIRITSSSLLT